jgi:hypothetical protein
MKVLQKQNYSPITIVLETEEEANVLWHIANQSIRPDYSKSYGIGVEEDRIKYHLWEAMDKFVHPLMV